MRFRLLIALPISLVLVGDHPRLGGDPGVRDRRAGRRGRRLRPIRRSMARFARTNPQCDVLRREIHALSHEVTPCELAPECHGSPLLCPVALDPRIDREYERLRDALHAALRPAARAARFCLGGRCRRRIWPRPASSPTMAARRRLEARRGPRAIRSRRILRVRGETRPVAIDPPTMRSGTTQSDAARATARLVEALRDPIRFPHPTSRVRVIETHVSYIVLTGSRAYKIKKPLRLDFLDFTSLASRRRACEDELRLNRRTAPDLYLRVARSPAPPTRRTSTAPATRSSTPSRCASSTPTRCSRRGSRAARSRARPSMPWRSGSRAFTRSWRARPAAPPDRRSGTPPRRPLART